MAIAAIREEDDRAIAIAKQLGDGPHLVRKPHPERDTVELTPENIVHGDADQNVNVEQGRRMNEALVKAGKTVEYIEFDDLAHDP